MGSDTRESKTLGKAQGASHLGRHVRPCCTNAPGAPLAGAGCTGPSALRISEVTAERSPRGPVAHHLLPSSQRAPDVSSVPVLAKYLHSAVQPKAFEDKGPLTPSHRGARHQNARMQQPASVHMEAQGSSKKGWFGVKTDLHQAWPRCLTLRKSSTTAQAAFAHMPLAPRFRNAAAAAATSWEEPRRLQGGRSRVQHSMGKIVPGRRR